MRGHFVRALCITASITGSLVVSSIVAAEEATVSDEAVENFLLNAEVVRVEQMLPGSTYPMAIELSDWVLEDTEK